MRNRESGGQQLSAADESAIGENGAVDLRIFIEWIFHSSEALFDCLSEWISPFHR